MGDETVVAAYYDVGELLWEQKRRLYAGKPDDIESQLAGFVAWCRDNVVIAHPTGKRAFDLRPPQIETARSYIEEPKTLILKARQIGFTTLTMNFCLWKMLFNDDFSVIALSRKEDDSKAALSMASLAYNSLPEPVKAMLPRRLDNASQRITFSNGSWMESHPSANNPARSRTASLMILDEWAFMPNPDDAWASIQPAADIGGRIICLSTANGWGNTFHTFWTKANSGDNNFKPIFFPWNAVPERGDDWYEAQKRDMLPWQLAQEYPSDPDEAFIRSGNPVFDIDALRAIIVDDPMVGDLIGDDWRRREFSPAENGRLSVYETPQMGAMYVLGVDVAQGLHHGDYSSVHVMNAKTGVVAAHWHGHMDPDLFGHELCAIGAWYNTALAGIEVNNHGLTTAKTVQRNGYQNIYYRRRLGSRRETLSEELGWLTTRTTKPYMIDGLAQALRGEMLLLDYPTVVELIQYVRKPDGSTEGSPHDDRVISLAIANEMRRFTHSVTEVLTTQAPPGSFAWELEKMQAADRATQQANSALGRWNVRGQRGSMDPVLTRVGR